MALLPAAGIGGAFTWIGQAAVAYFNKKSDRQQHKDDNDLSVKQHTDKLVFEVLKAAREEVAAARVEAAEMRTLQLRMVHFDEAMELLQLLFSASTDDDVISAKRRVGQFLKRMERFNDANGALRNEAQVQQSRNDLGAEATDLLKGMPK